MLSVPRPRDVHQSRQEAYERHIAQKRAVELMYLRRFRLLTIVVVAMGRASPVLACCLTFFIFDATGSVPSVEKVFTTCAPRLSSWLPCATHLCRTPKALIA